MSGSGKAPHIKKVGHTGKKSFFLADGKIRDVIIMSDEPSVKVSAPKVVHQKTKHKSSKHVKMSMTRSVSE